MFITVQELNSVIYEYQLTQITEQNNDIALTAIATAEQEVRSYLTSNNLKQWQDGRPRYDVDLIFSAQGENRNALIMQHVKTVAVWYVCQLSNPDIIYEHIKERYDRAIDYLNRISKGTVTLNLPILVDSDTDPATQKELFRFGSRTKFNHE
jgi:phage gp36-like protein